MTPSRFTLRSAVPLTLLAASLVAACGGGSSREGGAVTTALAEHSALQIHPGIARLAWLNHGGDAQHSGRGTGLTFATQSLDRIVWRADVDLEPGYRDGNHLTSGHYGSPVITGGNTVLLPVRVSADGHYRIEARDGGTGQLKWQSDTDFAPLSKTFSYSIAATPAGRVYFPGIGGKLYYRDGIDGTPGDVQTVVFYGADQYAANKAAFDAGVVINTPITTDAAGNAWFGFSVSGDNPAGLSGGIARVDPAGQAVWVSAAAVTGDPAMVKAANSAAPAVTADGQTVYAVVAAAGTASSTTGYLVALDSTTLATRGKVRLLDPETGAPARISQGGTSSPLVGPDGNVYFGVLGSGSGTRPGIGWLLHYDSSLLETRTPGGFGLDTTPTVVPASALGGYMGMSTYLLAIKYNDYYGGQHQMAVLDPNERQADRYVATLPAMKEVITILSPTGADHEWCVNTAAFDPNTQSVYVNNSDGYLYRWDLMSNTLAEKINLNSGYYQAYTPTALGPDGKVYAINNASLMAIGQ